MQQINPQTVVSEYLPYIKNNILSKKNFEKDTVLQTIFQTEDFITQDQRNVLGGRYFRSSGNIFDVNKKCRQVFWDEFIEFVRDQRKLCNDDYKKIEERLLPVSGAENNQFSTTATEVLSKFLIKTAKIVEKEIIKQLIENKQIAGEMLGPEAKLKAAAKAKKDKELLENGKLILVKLKNGEIDYLSDKEIKDAIDDLGAKYKLYKETLQNEETEVGQEEEIIPLIFEENPGSKAEAGLILKPLLKEVQKKETAILVKFLQESDLEIEGEMKVDDQGLMKGKVVNKKTKESMQVTVNLNEPGEPKFFFRLPNSTKKENEFDFDLNKKEIEEYFKKQKKSPYEVLRIKQKEKEKARPEAYPHLAPTLPAKTASPEETGKAGITSTWKPTTEDKQISHIKKAMEGARLIAPASAVNTSAAVKEPEQLVEEPVVLGGVIGAKRQLALNQQLQANNAQPQQLGGPNTPRRQVSRAPKKRKKKRSSFAKKAVIATSSGILVAIASAAGVVMQTPAV